MDTDVEVEVEVGVDEGGAAEDKAASRRNKLARSLLNVPLLVEEDEDGDSGIARTADRRAVVVASAPNTVDGMVVPAAVAAVAIDESTAAVVLIS